MFRRLLFLPVVAFLSSLHGAAGPCELAQQLLAGDFVVQTAVYAGDESTPVAENRTVFVGDKVYDELLGEPNEISVLNLNDPVVELLDVRRKVKSTLTGNDLLQFVAAMKVEALQAKSPLARFAAAPHFELLQHEDTHQFRLKSEWLEYQVQTVDCDPQISQKYRKFCDWYARLNATRVGALPPHARLELNSQLTLHPRFPTRIQLTIRNEKTAQELISRHELIEKLSDDDQQRIRQIDLDVTTFREVPLTEFRGLKLADSQR